MCQYSETTLTMTLFEFIKTEIEEKRRFSLRRENRLFMDIINIIITT